MIINRIVNKAGRIINSRRGWRTSRKIIVIESDDWGGTRMPNYDTYKKLLNAGLHVDKCRFNKYDSLASIDDLSLLFEVLKKFKDYNGNHPVITANTIVANPDFEKIKKSNFENYYYEDFRATLKKYPNHNLDIWKEGMAENLFIPQFHGREHLNVSKWLELLRANSVKVRLGFDNGIFGLSSITNGEDIPNLAAALNAKNIDEINSQENILNEGIELFKDIFGYYSKSFIAPNYIWHTKLEKALHHKNIKYLQGVDSQFQPNFKNGLRYIPHFIGEKNKLGQIYLVRNCTFEPSSLKQKNWIDSCLKEINTAFSNNKPAIIVSHRVNFIGFINNSNRDKNLILLDVLLKSILKKWKDVEFMTSSQLGDLIARG